jgi:bifunctional DNase/RNase
VTGPVGPTGPAAAGGITVPVTSGLPSVSNTSDDLATPDDPTTAEVVTAVTPSEGTAVGDVRLDDVPLEDVSVEDVPPEQDEPVYTIPTGPIAEAPDYRMALVSAVNVDLPSQHPTVLLRESESPRRQLSFSIGLQDGIVLSHAMRRIPTPRPLTHELTTTILAKFDIDVVAVRLVGRQGAVYFAELDLRGRTGRSVLSARPSDALTLALLQPVPVPILIDARLFDPVGDVAPPS